MSPVLPREERDAIRARHDEQCSCAARVDGMRCTEGRLLDALDAAPSETEEGRA